MSQRFGSGLIQSILIHAGGSFGVATIRNKYFIRPQFKTVNYNPSYDRINYCSKKSQIPYKKTRFDRDYSTENSVPSNSEIDYRSFIRPLLLHIHPDFFQYNSSFQSENDRSLKQLNSLLDIIDNEMKKPPGLIQLDKNKVQSKFSLAFYVKDQKKDKTKHKPNFIKALYEFNPNYYTKPFVRDFLEQDLRIFLNELLSQVSLPLLPINNPLIDRSTTIFNEDVTRYHDTNTEDLRDKFGTRYNLQSNVKESRLLVKNILSHKLDRHYPLAAMAADKLGDFWEEYLGKDPLAEIALGILELRDPRDREKKNIHYHLDLTEEQRVYSMENIKNLWFEGVIPADIPVYVTSKENEFLDPNALIGFISIPWRFDNEELLEYLKKHLIQIMNDRYEIRVQLLQAEHIMKQFQTSLKLSFFDTACDLAETCSLLIKINKLKQDLIDKDCFFEGMDWLIISEKQAEANIKNIHDCKNKDSLSVSDMKKDREGSHENEKSGDSNDFQSVNKEETDLPTSKDILYVHSLNTKITYEWRSDRLSIPCNITGEEFLSWIEENKELLEFRKRLFPSKKWSSMLYKLLKNLKNIIGAKSICFSAKVSICKNLQLNAIIHFQSLAELLRSMKLKDFVIVIGNNYYLSIQKKIFRIPYNFKPENLKAFIKYCHNLNLKKKNNKSQF